MRPEQGDCGTAGPFRGSHGAGRGVGRVPGTEEGRGWAREGRTGPVSTERAPELQ